ncbi:MAG: FtsX-like permease family protein [Planctomycetota bacterium]
MRWLLAIFHPWTLRMAWRESRRARTRLLLCVSSMTMGVAALVAITSFGENLREAVDAQARTLLGADLRISSRTPLTEEVEQHLQRLLIEEHGGAESRQVSFSSMALFPETGATRLVRVRAISGEYPFYGEISTDPEEAGKRFPAEQKALVEPALLAQFTARTGDVIRIGALDYEIAGALRKIPGESAASALFGPTVYLPLDQLDPNLLVRGSRVDRSIYYRFGQSVDADLLKEDLEEFADANRLHVSTVRSSQDRLDRTLENLYGFLNLVGFFALLLGALGVGSGINVYVRQKTDTVATLRCLGAKAHEAFAVYLASALALGAIGALAGAAIGLMVQRLLPPILANLLPLEIDVSLSPLAALTGLAVGLSVALAFTLLPLLPLRNISPLRALRSSLESAPTRDLARYAVMFLIACLVFGFAWTQSGKALAALVYTGGIGVTFLGLAVCARLLRYLARHRIPIRLPFEWRQGVANLYRPGNQTLLLMVSIGFGAFLILTLYQTRTILLGELDSVSRGEQPNVLLFDIQDDQLEPIKQHLAARGLPVLESVPIVTMLLQEVKGRAVSEIREDARDRRSNWALNREYRSSYREELADAETLLSGEWVGRAAPGQGPIPVSLEQRIADELGVNLGDELVWDVQGVSVRTVVGSIREVDWRQMRPNFFALFPLGVLEQAPKFHVLVTRTSTAEQIGDLQRSTVEQFSNVSIVDVSLILSVAQDLIDRVSLVIRFMSMFSILTGLLVLISTVLTSRFQRLEEGVLLRTLGARKRTVFRIMTVEYLLLGSLAALTGLLLSILATWGLAVFWFEVPFRLATMEMVICLALITGLTVLVGRLGSLGVHDRPPLECLRDVLRIDA